MYVDRVLHTILVTFKKKDNTDTGKKALTLFRIDLFFWGGHLR